ncbi:HindVP family restriction endonuclease [Candidatus Parabeggiatoa sp. HSG14]|uniref:HindVP family restriction endonuclease n=1 Tax=Candidatus Parabeggiatoa sp. HSG14 TaxID=3055593 RepID=UPI0025A86775|nr:HindVP family restriction endonuclease [Thiotrichales bacterium HSG14]
MLTIIIKQPRLFGIEHSNRDFSKKESWGKNQFNSSFPVALACYMSDKNLENVYLKLDKNLKVIYASITSESLFGITPKSEELFFAFETPYTPYQQLLIGNIPRADIVTQNTVSGNCLRGLEIKLRNGHEIISRFLIPQVSPVAIHIQALSGLGDTVRKIQKTLNRLVLTPIGVKCE